jgi:hypothetical protein
MRPLPLVLLAACGGVSSHLAKTPAPATVAVLPVSGTADPGARELTRALFTARLAALGFHVVENSYVDRMLSERGLLRDPEAFDTKAMPAKDLAAALGVDAVLVSSDLDSSSFNVFILRRQSVSGNVRLVDRQGSEWWSASYTASQTGGFLLKSGQVLSELRAQGEHGTPMATVALVDEFVEDVADTLPAQTPGGPAIGPGVPLVLADVAVERGPSPIAGCERLVVTAQSHEAAELEFDAPPTLAGVPMAHAGKMFVGAADVPVGKATAVKVHARSPYGELRMAEARK